jgi:hypothetical protein
MNRSGVLSEACTLMATETCYQLLVCAGVDNPIHLVASHCKPWSDSTNDERLSTFTADGGRRRSTTYSCRAMNGSKRTLLIRRTVVFNGFKRL